MTETGYTDSTGQFRKTTFGRVRVPTNGILAAGTALAAFADGASPTPGLAVDGSEAMGIRWNNHPTPAAIFTGVMVPTDRLPNTDMTVRILAYKTGATVGDAVTFTLGVFFQPKSALYDADSTAGGASSAMTGDAATKTVQECTRTIAAADIPNATRTVPAFMTLTYKPTDATLGTDDVTVLSVELEYVRIVLPD